MASNMPGMVPNPGMMMPQQQQQLQQLQQQQTHPQLKTLVYSHLMSTMSMAPSGSWQNNFSTGDRFNKALNLYEPPLAWILVLAISSQEIGGDAL